MYSSSMIAVSTGRVPSGGACPDLSWMSTPLASMRLRDISSLTRAKPSVSWSTVSTRKTPMDAAPPVGFRTAGKPT